MCGIGGMIGAARDREGLLSGLLHRGPDHHATRALQARDGTPVLLAFARLAIIDLSPAGHQPMSTGAEDGDLTIVYNGEVYNFPALRRELEARGHRFRSHSDTEVILRGYREWGIAVIDRLRGMFAFALWDGGAQELHLVRDRLGVKPLYYVHGEDGAFAFASEVRALLRGGAVAPRLDPLGVHGFLALGSVPQPRTILRGVSLLLPGHHLTVRPAGGRATAPAVRRYYTLPPPGAAPADDPAAAVAPVLREAVSLRLVADVPVGVLLSGGVDSSAVAALGRDGAAGLSTFTLGYGPGLAESEEDEAREMARQLGTRHHERTLSAADVLAQLPAYLSALDQPSVDGLNTYLVAEMVRGAGLKVALSGLGGDEVFLGYAMHRPFSALYRAGRALGGAGPLLRHALRGLPWEHAPLRVQKWAAALGAAGAGPPDEVRARRLYAALRGLFPAPQLRALLAPEVEAVDPAAHVRLTGPLPAGERGAVELFSLLDLENYLPNTLLRDADVMSMVHGVELRVPLCDAELVGAVLGLGAAARARRPGGPNKPLLIAASRSPLVAAAAARRKRGFVLPLASFLRGGLRPAVASALEDAGLCQQAGLRPAAVRRLWQEFLSNDGGQRSAPWRVWAVFVLLSWAARLGARL